MTFLDLRLALKNLNIRLLVDSFETHGQHFNLLCKHIDKPLYTVSGTKLEPIYSIHTIADYCKACLYWGQYYQNAEDKQMMYIYRTINNIIRNLMCLDAQF